MRRLKLSYLLILLALGLGLSSISEAENPQATQKQNDQSKSSDQPEPSKKKAQPKQDQRGTEKTPIFIQIAPSPNTEKETANAKRVEDEKTAERRHQEIITATNRGIIASGVQAFALFVTIVVMIWTTTRQLRAYISVDTAEPALIDVEGGMDIHLRMKNTGKTPAYKMSYSIHASVELFPLNRELPPVTPSLDKTIYVPPGMEIGMITQLRKGWTHSLLTFCAGGTNDERLYVWGEVHYVDTFKRRRFVKFRFMSRGEGSGPVLDYCPEGNDAD